MLKIWTFKFCKLNLFMAFTIEQKFHLVIVLRFQDRRTRKCAPKFSKRELKLVLENLKNFMILTIGKVRLRIPLFLTKNVNEQKLHDLVILLISYNVSIRAVLVAVEQYEVSTFCAKSAFFQKCKSTKITIHLKNSTVVNLTGFLVFGSIQCDFCIGQRIFERSEQYILSHK